ncbi:hypothetical protein MLD38_030487 [Melastoma candidum]|uniref:Uncharacterized protein n=1 Tax=Melastoma candidum TaxID=119954 RepID=A0ACB9MNW5_9MYRT|nr:hypothetical protein MLD38_030487 [Melastoma candidum]
MIEGHVKAGNVLYRGCTEWPTMTFSYLTCGSWSALFRHDGKRIWDEPIIEHYGCFVDILCGAAVLKEAKYVINTMPVKLNHYMDELAQWLSGNLKMGEYAARNFVKIAPETIGCYVVLSNMWNKVAEVRETTRKMGFEKDPVCISFERKGVLHEFTVGERSHLQTDKIFLKLTGMGEKLKSACHALTLTKFFCVY